jgi:hypothetical protein
MYKTRCWVVSGHWSNMAVLLIFFSREKSQGRKSVLSFRIGRSARIVRAPGRGWRLAIPMFRGRCRHHCCGGERRMLAGARGAKRIIGIASQTYPSSSRRSAAAPLNVCVRSQTRPGRGGILAKAARRFSFILTGAENRKSRNVNASLRLRTAWPDRFDVRQCDGLRGSDGAAANCSRGCWPDRNLFVPRLRAGRILRKKRAKLIDARA